MQVGDLIKHTKNSMPGLILKVDKDYLDYSHPTLYHVLWFDARGSQGPHWEKELELVSSSR